MLIDGEERSRATDPRTSFIVQAPAGSGKTEILTQRYLRLLSTVQAPEHIVALTFTRKAAHEMRERILIALQDAAASKEASSPHQQNTLEFATQALKHSAKQDWDLLAQPNRLKINTIDSLCQSINHAIPLLEQHIAYAQITDKPEKYYVSAARACIQYAMETTEYQQAIKTLLLHVDNKYSRLLRLLKQLLAQRDLWLNSFFQARSQEKKSFEEALYALEQHELSLFKHSLPWSLQEELMRLARELTDIENNPNSPRHILHDWCDFKQSTQHTAKALSALLLGSDGNFRKCFDHHVGLKSGACSAAQYKALKEASRLLLEQLADYPDFLECLVQVSSLPKPEYDPKQWEALSALFDLLPLLVSHLQLFFSQDNQIDFAAIAQQALQALGEPENPTDLALYLDHKIHHLLVDEFQDTSITQFELLTQLVQGFQPGDGKTLFIVGDPMQSIYRFRQAEVGLFMRAKNEGIGSVGLEFLELGCNFRSTPTIINWVNKHFANIFPKQADIESGAVSFHSSIPVLKNHEESEVYAFQYPNAQQEAEHLLELVQQELSTRPNQSIAILVRSRSHLSSIISLLRHHNIPYQGTDIDLLANVPHIQDAWSLTQALLTPANRLSWLALLRSPYCGVSLQDLHAIAQYNKKQSIYSTLLASDKILGLSEEGCIRAQFFIQVMHQALMQRFQSSLSSWVSSTLKKLHLDIILNSEQLEDLEQFWLLLDKYDSEGRLTDMKEFSTELNRLYSQKATPARLHIMTIHKSKGLEFDTVFLPGLGAQANRGDEPLLRWLKIPTPNGAPLLLISPIKGASQVRCTLYDYLGQVDAKKDSYEKQRLLYVAVTRAKSRLYLLNSSTKAFKGSLHYLLKEQEFIDKTLENTLEEGIVKPPLTYQLPLSFYTDQPNLISPSLNPIPPLLSSGIPRLTGILAHRVLQWICENHPSDMASIPWNMVRNECMQLGFSADTEAQVLQTIKQQIHNFLADPIGAWIAAPHKEEHNEYSLLVPHQGSLATKIIDRVFEDDGTLWIIDFKTGSDDKQTLTEHQKQLAEYAMCLSHTSSLPIHCGLYYLANNQWLHWSYS